MKPLLLSACLALVFAMARAQTVPPAINYQGRLTDEQGQPLASGEYSIAFRLWSDATSTATNAPNNLVWGRERAVVVVNGQFNVILDDAGVPVPGVAVSNVTVAFVGASRYLGLTVTRAPSGSVPQVQQKEILPRQQILSAPYAIEAQRAAVANDLLQELRDSLCPPGTVIAWMGTNNVPPAGWQFCWGQEVSRTDPKYARIFSVIGISSGAGHGSTTFHLPDLRGIFLRGVSGARSDEFADPDSATRTARSGGTPGNVVGSVQIDALKSHRHAIDTYDQDGGDGFADRSGIFQVGSGRAWTLDTGGSETRPKNVYVHYIIKL